MDPDAGWLPKNPALSLAIHRASPASIRFPPGRTRELVWKRDKGRDARASPEDSQKPSPIRRLCPFENCPADTFLTIAQRCAAPASSITFRLE